MADEIRPLSNGGPKVKDLGLDLDFVAGFVASNPVVHQWTFVNGRCVKGLTMLIMVLYINKN